MKNLLFIFLLLFWATACKQKDGVDANAKQLNKTALLNIDKAFSDMCEAKGMKQAFIEYIDSNGVLLRPNHLPIIGAKAIDYLIQQDDSGFTLSWEPHNAEVAESGELGFTYGVYELTLKAKDSSIYGSYVSIWKKQEDGKWKFVLDTGNEGIGSFAE